ncbi:MAG: CapA family protein [Bacteroidales bacterium]|nr:CapA family protein [Bacteroidales bacterium]
MTLIMVSLLFCANVSAQFKYEIPFPGKSLHHRDTASIFIIGDVMMHSRQMEYEYREFLNDIQDKIGAADISIANMEFALAGEPYTGYPSFSAPDDYAEYICECGVDIFLLANNHIYDKGRKGLDRTLAKYGQMRDSLGTWFTGIGEEPLVFRCKGMSFAIINFTYEINGVQSGVTPVNMMDKESVARMFKKAKEKNADFIIAMPHWGEEYQLHHSKEQEEWAEWMVSQGADVIVGGHPHVIQDTTHVNGIPVIYSVGNAISNMSARNTQLELAVTLRFINDDGRMIMLEPSFDFMWCSLPGMFSDNYSTISVKKWANRKSDWLTESDYNRMIETYDRVKDATGIID